MANSSRASSAQASDITTGTNTTQNSTTSKTTATKSKSKSTMGGRVEKKSGSSLSNSSHHEPYMGSAKGVTQLPVARVKRIIKEDKDVGMVSNDAVFLISMATELFLESFTAKAFSLARAEKRKTVSYKDLATAVTQYDSLEFLQDVIPKTMTLGSALEKQRIAKEREERGDVDEDEMEQENHNGGDTAPQGADDEDEGEADPRSDADEFDDGALSSRPMSEDDLDHSGPDDMDED